jgi:topoisomerase IA-like protein
MKIKYVDHRPLVIPYLNYHRGGVTLPSGDNILKVTEDEARNLMKIKNGSKICFEEIKERSVRKEEIKDEVIDDVSR